MKITLKNFRCYENSSFDFGEKGLVLISGKSGAGKSGILLGICFALFGTGNKLTMYGKTSCSVTLEFEDMVITRTKRPNRLIVDNKKGVIQEDDAAQIIINDKFGETFQTTGYICQNAINSFIMMSPIDKLGFLEKFAFQDTDLFQIKTRCKNIINERYETLLKTTSQLEMATSMIKELKEPSYMEFPLQKEEKNIPIKLREKAIKNITIKYKNCNILISKNTKKNKSLQNEIHSLQLLESKLQHKQESINSLNEKLYIAQTELEKYNETSVISLQEYEDQLSFILTQKELISLKFRYDEDIIRLDIMKKQELSDTLEKIKILEKDLWVDYTEDDATYSVSDNRQIIKDLEKLQELKNDMSHFIVDEKDLEKYIEDLEESKKTLEIK